MSDIIIYGGAFNPPTLGHLKIIEYLIKKFPNNKLVVLPTNNYYKLKEIVSFDHRKKMLEIMCKDYLDKICISDYEQTLDKYYGTYYTLKHFNNPLFVIGADSLDTIKSWIKFPDVVIENKFIVFPRANYDINKIIESNEILLCNKDKFIICDDFEENNISSTQYRKNKNDHILSKEVKQYINTNNLY